mmetsp:Transcript_39343/g.111488  ORF Transcript_39343/g.111488 Transcript_39343/m.111488 type:complete len:1197 (-) Transcript_39343:277-3867(-)
MAVNYVDDMDDTGVHFCFACKSLHPLAEFSRSGRKNVCLPKKRHIAKFVRVRRREHAETQRQCIGWLRQHVRRFVALFAEVMDMFNCQLGRDPGRRVWAAGVFSFLGGDTSLAKLAIATVYPLALWLLDWRKAEAWVAVFGSFFSLHVAMPYLHQHFYVPALHSVRQSAEERGLAVSQSFQLLDPRKHAKYEAYAQQGSHSGWGVAIFAFFAAFCLQPTWAAYKAYSLPPWWALAPLLLVGGVFFPVRAKLVAAEKRSMRQRLDSAAVVASQLIFVAPLVSGWLTGNHQCGTPDALLVARAEKLLALYGVLFQIVYSAAQTALVECPLVTEVVVMEAVVGMSRTIATPITFWCIEAETGKAFSNLVPAICATSRLMIAAICMVVRVKWETRKLLGYIQGLPFKASAGEDSTWDSDGGDRPFFRFTTKIRGVTPGDLPKDLRERVVSMLEVQPDSLTGAIRPGCVLLSLVLRFSSWAQLQTGRASMLSHRQWAEALLGRRNAEISVNIQGSPYVVREDGRLRQPMERVDEAPSIASVGPLVTPCDGRCSTLTVWVAGIDVPTSFFEVLLQNDCYYHQLEVLASQQHTTCGMAAVIVRLPEHLRPGLSWLDISVATDGHGPLVMSEGFPILFSPPSAIISEMNHVLPHAIHEGPQMLASLYQDLSDCLHHRTKASPQLLLKVTKLGLTECFQRLATRKLLMAADRLGQGLLGTAAQSDSARMVMTVLSTLRNHHLRIDPCRLAGDADGYSALHWAATMGNLEIVYLLLSETSEPLRAWQGLRSRVHYKSPTQLMQEKQPEFFIDEHMLPPRHGEQQPSHDDFGCISSDSSSPEGSESYSEQETAISEIKSETWAEKGDIRRQLWAESKDVVGGCMAHALQGRTPASRLAILAIYLGVFTWAACFGDPLGGSLAVACVEIHFLLIFLHSLYLEALREVRAPAAQQGLLVSKFLRPLHPSVAQMANRFQPPPSSVIESLIGISLWLAEAVALYAIPAVLRGGGAWEADIWAAGVLAARGWTMWTGRQWHSSDALAAQHLLWVHFLPAVYSVAVEGGPDRKSNSTRSSLAPSGSGVSVAPLSAPNRFLLLGAFLVTLDSLVLCLNGCSAVSDWPDSGWVLPGDLLLLGTHGAIAALSIILHQAGGWELAGPVYVFLAYLTAQRLALVGFRLHHDKTKLCAFLRSAALSGEYAFGRARTKLE